MTNGRRVIWLPHDECQRCERVGSATCAVECHEGLECHERREQSVRPRSRFDDPAYRRAWNAGYRQAHLDRDEQDVSPGDDSIHAAVSASLIAATVAEGVSWPSFTLSRVARQVTDAVAREVRGDNRVTELGAAFGLGCPNTPDCGRLLTAHAHDGWDGNGDAINPRCPS